MSEELKEELKGYQQMYFDKVMIINKAIEYINKLHSYPMLTKYNSLELLEILRGVENVKN